LRIQKLIFSSVLLSFALDQAFAAPKQGAVAQYRSAREKFFKMLEDPEKAIAKAKGRPLAQEAAVASLKKVLSNIDAASTENNLIAKRIFECTTSLFSEPEPQEPALL